jgi:hypothetical protein
MRFQYDKGKICVISAVYEKNKTELASKKKKSAWTSLYHFILCCRFSGFINMSQISTICTISDDFA